jgi:hypothetical protein
MEEKKANSLPADADDHPNDQTNNPPHSKSYIRAYVFAIVGVFRSRVSPTLAPSLVLGGFVAKAAISVLSLWGDQMW